MQSQVLEYIEKNRETFLKGLCELIKVESVSTLPEKKGEILKCADLEVQNFKRIGLENVQLLQTIGYPLVYGDWLHAEGKPTLLIYGHYDVQPADPIDKWTTPPFEPTVRNGNLYARGACDNKGQHFSHLCAIESYLKTLNKLPLNVKVILEGEEEVGSAGVDQFIRENKKLLDCDVALVSDTGWYDADHPSVCYSLRGLIFFELLVHGPSHDLHSGTFGGSVRNPAQALSWILSKLKDESEKVLIPGFYDDVIAPSAKQHEELKKIFNAKEFLANTGSPDLVSEAGYTPIESVGIRPTIEVNGIYGGYQGAGTKTIIPSFAGAKISCRLVANQDPAKMQKLVQKYIESICPKGVKFEIKFGHSYLPFYVDPENDFLKKAVGGYEEAFGKKMVYLPEGGSIGVLATFQKILNCPIILVGLGLPDDRMHSPDEKISLNNFYSGIKGAALAYQRLAEK